MPDENSIQIHRTFRSPEDAIPTAEALAEMGFDVRMHVVLDASIGGTDEELQRVHRA